MIFVIVGAMERAHHVSMKGDDHVSDHMSDHVEHGVFPMLLVLVAYTSMDWLCPDFYRRVRALSKWGSFGRQDVEASIAVELLALCRSPRYSWRILTNFSYD